MTRILTYTFRGVETPVEVEFLRQIRNDCRLTMTRHRAEITREQQQEWWRSLDHSVWHPFLLCIENPPIGYGLLHDEGDRTWLSGGVKEERRRQGWGRIIFEELISRARFQPWLEVWEDNEAAVCLYESLGFTTQYVTIVDYRMLLTMSRP